jgi:glycerophosphoryl diester phosphodiesterase
MTRLTGEVGPVLVRARAAGLEVHPYTVRAEASRLTRLANGLLQGCVGEVVHLLSGGATGVFIDQPQAGVAGRDLFLQINDAG